MINEKIYDWLSSWAHQLVARFTGWTLVRMKDDKTGEVTGHYWTWHYGKDRK